MKLSKNHSRVKGLEAFFIFYRIEPSKKIHDRLDRYDRKKYEAKKQKLREKLDISENELILAERIKKKSVQNIYYFHKKEIFTVKNKRKN